MKSEMGGTCITCVEEEWRVQGLVGKTEGKKPLGRPRGRWEDYSKGYLQGGCRGGGGMCLIDSAQDMESWWGVVNVVISLQVP